MNGYLTYFFVIWIITIIQPILSSSVSGQISYQNTYDYQECVQRAKEHEKGFRFEEALQWYQKALSLNQEDPTIHYALVRQHVALKNYEQAYQELLTLVENHPNYAKAYNLLGVFAKDIHDDLGKSETYFRRAIEIDPEYNRPKYLLANLLITLERYPEAQTLFEEMISNKTDSMKAYEGLGQVLLKQAKLDGAIEALNQAIELNPIEPEPHRLLGQALARQGKRERAQEEMKIYKNLKDEQNRLDGIVRMLRQEPNQPNLWVALAQIYTKRNQLTSAVNALQKGISFVPDDDQMHGFLGTLCLKQKQPDKAANHFRTAIQMNPDEANYHHQLGLALLMTHEYAEAKHHFQIAIQNGLNDETIQYHLNLAQDRIDQTTADTQ